MLNSLERAVLRAFAEALLPPGGRLPGAEGGAGIAIVAPVTWLLGSAPARIGAAARIALVALELSTFPRRFSRLDRARRESHLERLEHGGGAGRELFLFLKALCTLAYARHESVSAALDIEPRCEVAQGSAPRRDAPPLERDRMEPPAGVERCDVVVVGSGAGGASAARILAEAGLSVVVVEEGEYRDARDYSRDPLDALGTLYRDGGLTVCEGRPAIPLPVGRCVGGTTVVNSGTCFRTPDDVLVGWRDELGIGWATELESDFEAIERDLQVRPVDPDAAGRNAELCRRGAEAIGASNGPIPRNAGDVVCCGTCPTGCALDAKQATHVSELPRAVAAGCVVRAGARAEEVVVRRRSAVGVVCRTRSGRYEVRARAVILAAGALGTPTLLLSQGIANASGEVGRNLRVHPACWVGARFEDDVRGWDGIMQSWYVDEWQDRGLFLEATFTPLAFGAHWLPGSGETLKERIARYGNLAVIGVHMSDRSSRGRVRAPAGRGRGRVRVSYRLTEEDARQIGYGIARAADIHFAAGAVEVYPQIAGRAAVREAERGSLADGRSSARDLRLEAFHPMGTARMGSDWRHSVVGPSGEVHELSGLFVADASIFPTSLRVNPMITIMACARRIARGVADRLC